MRKLVYIASPLSGNVEENLRFARQACLNAMSQGVTPFAPHLLYPQMLALCDELWLCGDRISPGMAAEEQLAREMDIPVKSISTEEILCRPPDELCWEEGPEPSPGPSMVSLC